MAQQERTQNNMIKIEETIKKIIEDAVSHAKVKLENFSIEHPVDLTHGDYSTNVALVIAKQLQTAPQAVAKLLVEKINQKLPKEISEVTVAGPGFINFKLAPEFFRKSVSEILDKEQDFGKNKNHKGERILIEYTDPNPFKQFHIGHLMSNAIGEAVSRLYVWSGAKVTRACYQGDVGLHIAKSLWGIMQIAEDFPNEKAPLTQKTKFLGDAYVLGSSRYEEDEKAKSEIDVINKKIYEFFDEKVTTDPELERIYTIGKKWSLQHFDEIYAKLGTHFDNFIFESSVAENALKIVRENTGKVFEEGDGGAIIYRGEQDGLHTRVFINKLGIPTYDAKDIGLAYMKDKMFRYDKSIIVTASEQQEYYKVVLAALAKIYPKIAQKTAHVTHGMMQFASGKMSSRKGNVITGESLLLDLEQVVGEKIADREFTSAEKDELKTIVAVAALKYSVLKQSPGKNIIFDMERAISFEGDSGPYLQYSYIRAKSVLEKATKAKIIPNPKKIPTGWQTTVLEKMLYRFPEVVEKSLDEMVPQNLVTYTTQIASEFNSFYANNQILDGSDSEGYKLAIVRAMMNVIANALNIIGVKVPVRM